MRKPLDGKVAVISGASHGLGLATTQELSALGAYVVLLAQDQGRLDAAAQTLDGPTTTPVSIRLLQCSQYLVAAGSGPTSLRERLNVPCHQPTSALKKYLPLKYFTKADPITTDMSTGRTRLLSRLVSCDSGPWCIFQYSENTPMEKFPALYKTAPPTSGSN